MKKVILFIFLLLIPIVVKASDTCIYDGMRISYNKEKSLFEIDGKSDIGVVINNNIISAMIKEGRCPSSSAINISCKKTTIGFDYKQKCTITLNDAYLKVCPYGDNKIKYEKGDFYLNNTITQFDNEIRFALLQSKCPDNIYIQKEELNNTTINKVLSEPTKRTTDYQLGDENSTNNNAPEKEDWVTEKQDIENMNFCEENGVKISMKIIGILILVAKIIVPLLIIIYGILDFYKAMVSNDEKTTKEAFYIFARRIIAGIIVFFIPTILDVILNLVDGYDGVESNASQCQSCLLHPLSECSTAKVGE